MKRVAMITATRAEYGLFRPILRAMARESGLEPMLIVTGTHLSGEFGSTVSDIEADGFRIHAKLDLLNQDDTGAGMARYIGHLTAELAGLFEKSKPDILLLLGDRGEMLAGAITASCMNIAILHLHGGESSGSVDDAFRKSITKLAHMHLPASEAGRANIIALGEDPRRIHVVGAPGLDDIKQEIAPPEEILRRMGFDTSKPLVLLVQHPVTTEAGSAGGQMEATLSAVSELGLQTFVVYPNADPGGRKMIEIIESFIKKQDFIKGKKSLPRNDYLSLMNAASVMVGNSSSGIIEAPSVGLPVVNIGTRQLGRERAANVIDVPPETKAIKNAIDKALNDAKFRKKAKECTNPYGDGNTAGRIIKILKKMEADADFLQKR
jgi:UDP-N-acetylglucosamine 2-epimerase (non-hydrolysing)/GDP/UDP-N,N'-diacetylbacillosamine 2-epimerase (hydrolysing)